MSTHTTKTGITNQQWTVTAIVYGVGAVVRMVDADTQYQAESKTQRELLRSYPGAVIGWPKANRKEVIEHQEGDSYVITGRLVDGRRFKAIHTSSLIHAMGINLWNGSVWRVRDGKRSLIKRVAN